MHNPTHQTTRRELLRFLVTAEQCCEVMQEADDTVEQYLRIHRGIPQSIRRQFREIGAEFVIAGRQASGYVDELEALVVDCDDAEQAQTLVDAIVETIQMPVELLGQLRQKIQDWPGERSEVRSASNMGITLALELSAPARKVREAAA